MAQHFDISAIFADMARFHVASARERARAPFADYMPSPAEADDASPVGRDLA